MMLVSQLFDYVESTWMSGLWSPDVWSSFMRAVRTNNDVEGWHNRLNRRTGRSNLSLYKLIRILHQEAATVSLQVSLVSPKKMAKYQRREWRSQQGRIFRLWDSYVSGEKSAKQLLRASAALYGNAPDGH